MLLCPGTLVTVQLFLSGLRLPFGLVDTEFEDLVVYCLRRQLALVSWTSTVLVNASWVHVLGVLTQHLV